MGCSDGSCSSGSCSDGSCSSGSCSDGSCGNDRLPPGMLAAYDLDQETCEDTLVFIESDPDGNLHPAMKGLLGKARELSSGRLIGFMFAGPSGREHYDELYSCGIDTVYHMRDPSVRSFLPMSFARAGADLARRVNPASVLFLATPNGRILAPLMAAMLNAGLTADCTELKAEGRKLTMIRPALGGNINASIECTSFPQMATVRPFSFPEPQPAEGRKGTAITRPYRAAGEPSVISVKTVPPEEDITSASILFSIGNGVKKRSSVEAVLKAAEAVGASVSCSRAVADKGWLPRSRQVGQSGQTVSPDLYVAFGISGSVQHLAGLRAKRIISVNRDRNAPINAVSDTVIVGDADAVIADILRQI